MSVSLTSANAVNGISGKRETVSKRSTRAVESKLSGSRPARSVKRQASSRLVGTGSSAYRAAASALANRPFHLELDQPVHLDGVLERQLLGDRLDETGD